MGRKTNGASETKSIDELPRVDVAIVTIKEEELAAVLRQLQLGDAAFYRGDREYIVGSIASGKATQTVAVTRCSHPGEGIAQDVAHDLFAELDPDWTLVVGIAGAAPCDELSLGDVAVGVDVLDVTVEEMKTRKRAYAMTSRAAHPDVENFATLLHARLTAIPDWSSLQSPSRFARSGKPLLMPAIDLHNKANFYGNREWKTRVRDSLLSHDERRPERRPVARAVSIASSDRLVKDPKTLASWLQLARQIKAVEMEAAGVHIAARGRRSRSHRRVLSIRGISDVVGFKRHEAWTLYACESAASLVSHLLRAGAFAGPRNP